MNSVSFSQEVNELSDALKNQLESVTAVHHSGNELMSNKDKEASFSVMGKIAALIDIIDHLNVPSISVEHEQLLIQAVSDGRLMEDQVSKYLKVKL